MLTGELRDMGDRDTQGDVYEYMLAKIATAGRNGQFRTPRHIIATMVELVAPKPEDVICGECLSLKSCPTSASHASRHTWDHGPPSSQALARPLASLTTYGA